MAVRPGFWKLTSVVLAFLISLPFAFAALIPAIVTDNLRVWFGSGLGLDQVWVVRFMLFILLYAIIYFGASKVFQGHQNIAITVSIVLGLLGSLTAPPDMLMSIATTYGLLGNVLFLLAPVFAGLYVAHKLNTGGAYGHVIRAFIFFMLAWLLSTGLTMYDMQWSMGNFEFSDGVQLAMTAFIILGIWSLIKGSGEAVRGDISSSGSGSGFFGSSRERGSRIMGKIGDWWRGRRRDPREIRPKRRWWQFWRRKMTPEQEADAALETTDVAQIGQTTAQIDRAIAENRQDEEAEDTQAGQVATTEDNIAGEEEQELEVLAADLGGLSGAPQEKKEAIVTDMKRRISTLKRWDAEDRELIKTLENIEGHIKKTEEKPMLIVRWARKNLRDQVTKLANIELKKIEKRKDEIMKSEGKIPEKDMKAIMEDKKKVESLLAQAIKMIEDDVNKEAESWQRQIVASLNTVQQLIPQIRQDQQAYENYVSKAIQEVNGGNPQALPLSEEDFRAAQKIKSDQRKRLKRLKEIVNSKLRFDQRVVGKYDFKDLQKFVKNKFKV